MLDRPRQFGHLLALLRVGRRDHQRQQVAERVHGDVEDRGRGRAVPATRNSSRRSWAIASKQHTVGHRRACWYTAAHGGKSCGKKRHSAPVLTSHQSASNTSRDECSRCGASSRINVWYGATNAHSSSETSLGYAFRASLMNLTYRHRSR